MFEAALAQLGERQTEDLKAPCSIHGGGTVFIFYTLFFQIKQLVGQQAVKMGRNSIAFAQMGFLIDYM